MHKTAAALLVILFFASSLITINLAESTTTPPTENTWTQKTPMHEARQGFGVAVVNGKIYALGGGTQSVEEYDPKTDTWTYKTSMPTERSYFATAAYQNKIYCIGGQLRNASLTAVNEVYDPATDTWENKTPMPVAKLSEPANVVNGKIYLIGGLPNNTLNQAYDPETDTWSTKESMPTEPAGPSGVYDGKIYVTGGYFDMGTGSWVTKTQIYDPNVDTWSSDSPPPESFGYASVGVTTGNMAPKRIYVISSLFELSYVFSTQVYDPETDSWISGAIIPTPRLDGYGVAVVDDLVYVIGGSIFTYPNSLSYYKGNPKVVDYATVEMYTPFGYGTMPPVINIANPRAINYTSGEVALNFTVNRSVDWMGYSLDGADNVTVLGNTTLAELPLGSHNVTVYACDSLGNMGTSQTVTFTVFSPPSAFFETFPILPFAVLIAAIAIASVSAVFILKKSKGCRLVEAEPTSKHPKTESFDLLVSKIILLLWCRL
jgi:N-acetylneuraminic acid mutarotase